MIITFTNVIGAIRTAFSVVRSGLKMWLGFETSETLGRELNDLSWLANGDWSINGDIASNDGGGSTLTNDILELGKTYQFKCKLSSYTSGQFSLFLGVSNQSSGFSDTDEFTFIGVCAGDTLARVKAYSGNGSLSISSLTIKELTQITPDKSGNNNVGELFTGKALEFDGSTDYVEVPNSTSLNVGTDDFTYCFWVYIGSAKAQRIIDKRNTKGFTFYLDASNVLRLELNDGTGFAAFILGTLTPSVWQRVVVSADRNGNAICYINGVAQTPVDISSKSGDLTDITSLFIGADAPSGETLFFDGFITDIQWYNTILSQSDVTYDYANPNKLSIDNPSTSLVVTNLKAYWALSEGDGLVAYDSGTNLEEDVVVNGDFALDSNWSEGAGWDIDVANNRITRTAQSGSTSASQNISFVSGKSYSITYTLDVSAGSFLIRLGGDGVLDTPARSVDDTYTEVVTANGNYTTLNLRALDGTFAGSISNVSVREVTASDHGGNINGADYVDAQPRIPQLGMMNWSKGSNLLTYSNDFTEWLNPSNIAITPNYGTSPIGTQDASRVVFTGSSQLLRLSFTTTTNLTASIYMKGSGTIKFGMNTGEEVQTLSTNWQRFIVSRTAGATSITFNTYGGTTARDIQVWGAQVEVGTSAGAYRLTDGGATLNSTVIPNPTIPTQDIFGNAVRDRLNSFNLDGSGYAEVADDDSLNMSSGFSTSFWVKLDEGSTTTDYDFLVCKGRGVGGTNTAYGFGTTYYNNTIIATINTSVSKYQAISSSQTQTGQWLFVCVTYEPNTILGLKLYLDDNSPNSITVSGTVDESHNLNVGRDSSFVTTRQSKNIISDVLFYDSVLTSDEVENNYNAGLSAHTN